ncbi:mitochondrial calcium uniporter regulator [Schizosaccharomyces osmophilus]|uniref:Mitochondrial calcium uniporter regulator n=1 Tax=Schizosaccharomyces osmophilus TaxID=2545709 RepID=A0AAE9WDS8_9SCHI|nr:mitochondrial calcium uniporter regulator [Schizosaccharomyces osmophilus]WBW74370.1 mitochondrial calcium uniporter regulator [Schizosaccharomyces osmophilus]
MRILSRYPICSKISPVPNFSNPCLFSPSFIKSNTPLFIPRRLYHGFNTLGFIRGLQEVGIQKKNAEIFTKTISKIYADSHKKMSGYLVTKEQQDRVMYQQKVDFAHLRSELQSIERQEMAALHAQAGQLFSDIERLRTSFRDQLNNSTAEARLQLSIERLNHYDEASLQELKLRELSAEIDTEMSNFRTQLATYKTQTLQWLLGIVTGSGALLLAYARLII